MTATTSAGIAGRGMTAAAMRTTLAALAALTVTYLAGCSGSGDGSASTQPGANPSNVIGTITVFAAASLTESFTEVGKKFTADHPGTKVTFNFAGSSALATQINHGAAADVFASASPTNMKTVLDAGNGEGSAVTFARNQLVIAVPKGNPKGITGLNDLTRPGVTVALCAPQVPCGEAARKALDAARLTVTPVTLEQDVKAALAKVRLGEVDAAMVYRTDTIAAASDVDAVEFPESASAVNDYSIIVLKNAPNKAGAQAFVDYVLSDKGKALLTSAGFLAP